MPLFFFPLAKACGEEGQLEEAQHLVREALAAVEHRSEHFWEAELHRLKGELHLRQTTSHASQAEACFHQALTIARRQQGKSLELRATMSLSRLWQQQDKQDEARALLTEVYGWFTEGFDTADLQEAKALLNDLA
jgi:predicted ATPase